MGLGGRVCYCTKILIEEKRPNAEKNSTCPRREAFPSVGTVLTADLLSLSDLHLNLNAQQYFWFLDIQACRVDCFAKDKGKHSATKYFTGNLFAQGYSQRCHGG